MSVLLSMLQKRERIEGSDPLLCVVGTVAQQQGALIDFVLTAHDLPPRRGGLQDWLLDRDAEFLAEFGLVPEGALLEQAQ